MKRLYLIRHAQSQSNVNVQELHKTPNPSIQLSDAGQQQAVQTANFLKTQLIDHEGLIVWNSPYQRTRQTAQIIKDNLNVEFTAKESIYLCERQFGLVDDVVNYRQTYLDEVNHYKMHLNTKTDFFVRPPLGESPFDMCIRVDIFLKEYVERSEFDNHVAISHGAAIRGMMTMALGLEFESYGIEKNPANASVLLMEYDGQWSSKGYIFKPEIETD